MTTKTPTRRTRSLVASALLAGALSIGAVSLASNDGAAETDTEAISVSTKARAGLRNGFGIRW